MLAACQPKKPAPVAIQPAPQAPAVMLAPAPVSDQGIQEIMAQVRAGEIEPEAAFDALAALAASEAAPIAEEARFRRVELLLELDMPEGVDEAAALLAAMPDHALAPYLHFWLAQYWYRRQEPVRAMSEMQQALEHPRLTRELADAMLRLGPQVADEVPDEEAVRWLMAAARIDAGGRDSWLRLAARRMSPAVLEALHADPGLDRALLARLDLHLARLQLLNGDMQGLARTRELLASLDPRAPELAQIRAWASGEQRPATIGVLLPLTGPYARFGEQALRGLRLGLARLPQIRLRIEDTGGDPEQAVAAYRALAEAGVSAVIGPLLAAPSAAVARAARLDVPVISLTGHPELAEGHPGFFVHTLSPLAEAEAIARHAWLQGLKRIVVLAGRDENGMEREAEAFAGAFSELGGEIAGIMLLDPGTLDHRGELVSLRFETDDEELLFELDRDLALFLPPLDVELRMPANFDAVYLALPGRQVALLAGQLAYVDVRGVPLLGSSRWMDGHLLDDRGRFLSEARFFASEIQSDRRPPRLMALDLAYRDVWGEPRLPDLSVLALDTLRILAVLSSRLGLHGRGLAEELQNPEGFPAYTGQVRFDAEGIGQKQLDVYRIERGRIVPAG